MINKRKETKHNDPTRIILCILRTRVRSSSLFLSWPSFFVVVVAVVTLQVFEFCEWLLPGELCLSSSASDGALWMARSEEPSKWILTRRRRQQALSGRLWWCSNQSEKKTRRKMWSESESEWKRKRRRQDLRERKLISTLSWTQSISLTLVRHYFKPNRSIWRGWDSVLAMEWPILE